jgi:hypothetical protein
LAVSWTEHPLPLHPLQPEHRRRPASQRQAKPGIDEHDVVLKSFDGSLLPAAQQHLLPQRQHQYFK